MTAVYLVIGVATLVGLWSIVTYNTLIRARNRVDESWSGIDVQLKRRRDLVPNLVEAVKGYARHESGTLIEATKARAAAAAATDRASIGRAETSLSRALGQLRAVAENYPQLRASQNFVELQQELTEVESEISAARSIYNSNAQFLNTRIQVFPNSIVAGLGSFEPRKFFEARLESDRAVPSASVV